MPSYSKLTGEDEEKRLSRRSDVDSEETRIKNEALLIEYLMANPPKWEVNTNGMQLRIV